MSWRPLFVSILLACLVPASGRAVDAEDAAARVELVAPLSTVVPITGFSPRPVDGIAATVVVPDTAPADLGVGAFVNDRNGDWYQITRPAPLPPGTHDLRFSFAPGAGVRGVGHRGGWHGLAGRPVKRAGLYFWTAAAIPGHIEVHDLRCTADAPPGSGGADHRLTALVLAGHDPASGRCRAETGQPWTLAVLPDPLPAAPGDFKLRLEATDPEGTILHAHACFSRPTTDSDGINSRKRPTGHGRYLLAFHPRMPGRHELALVATWADGSSSPVERRVPLPPLEVVGARWDPGSAVTLCAPLVTVASARGFRPQPVRAVEAEVLVPGDTPDDLGVGAFLADHDGNWFQTTRRRKLGPGRHRLRFPFAATSAVTGIGQHGDWPAHSGIKAWQAGIFFWSASQRSCRLWTRIRIRPGSPAGRPPGPPAADRLPSLQDLELLGIDTAAEVCHGRTGERWSLSVRPDPLPRNPFEPGEFELLLRITDPSGREQLIRGFYAQPRRLLDAGDREVPLIAGPGRFHVRYRPRLPGRHRLELIARWDRGEAAYPRLDGAREPAAARELRRPLPDLLVTGRTWDDYVRVDRDDPRFFSIGRGADAPLYWPLGLNIRSVNDARGQRCTGSRITPDRGVHAYSAYLHRLAAAGGDAVEIWMSSWNLALEWREDWRGYHGVGRYNLANAERLDRILDLAGDLGIRVNLVIDNHGKASDHVDHEWENNPYNRRIGGPVPAAWQWFTHPAALRGQERLRRYIVARYADHPAVLAWKLLTEINLTAGRITDQRSWAREAGSRWDALDIYGHPVTLHWSNDYHKPDRQLCVDPRLDFLCIDAYYWPRDQRQTHLMDLLWDSANDPRNGLSRPEVWARRPEALKPVLVTEYGGSWFAGPTDRLLAEHQSGPWVAAVSGHAGAPMLWWFEWVDQENLWRPFRALRRFLDGEDLRSLPDAPTTPIILPVRAPGHRLWVGAWVRRGRILGYVLDTAWQYDGQHNRPCDEAQIHISRNGVPAGAMSVEWWDPHNGTVVETRSFRHPGGPLHIEAPTFRDHLAFKLWRDEDRPAPEESTSTSTRD